VADTYNLGRATGLLADAVGQPGARRYRILARNDFELVDLTVERQQLLAMAEAVTKLLADYPAQHHDDPDRPPREGPMSFDMRPNLAFRVGELALGYDEAQHLFVVIARDVEEEAGSPPAFTCLVAREQLQAFGYAVYALVAGGRPRCPICLRPTDDGPHDHAQSNGHNKGA
jgi:uncharacterized repeat protein (TIGR03847 family)